MSDRAVKGPLSVGVAAPDFTLHSAPDQVVALHDLRGRVVILAFYPADWSPVCGDQMALYNEILPEFHRFKANLLGISVDGAWCHSAFAKDRKLHFPLLAASPTLHPPSWPSTRPSAPRSPRRSTPPTQGCPGPSRSSGSPYCRCPGSPAATRSPPP